MLYSLYDWQLAAFAPMRTMAVAGRNFLTNPDFPFTESRFFRGVAASCELFERVTRRYEKPEWGLDRTRIDGTWIGVSEEIVEARPHCNPTSATTASSTAGAGARRSIRRSAISSAAPASGVSGTGRRLGRGRIAR